MRYTNREMLIDVRIGRGKRKLTESIAESQPPLRHARSKMHRIPHISLYGSFSADYKQVERVKEALAAVGRRYSFLPYLSTAFAGSTGGRAGSYTST